MKASRPQAAFPLQHSSVSKLCVSSHANISVLLLLSWQLENTQSPTPSSAAGSTNWEGTCAGGWWRLPCSTAPGHSPAGMLMASHLLGQLQSLVFQQFQAPGSLLTTNILHAEGALAEALPSPPPHPPPVSQLALFDASKHFFFLFNFSVRKFLASY